MANSICNDNSFQFRKQSSPLQFHFNCALLASLRSLIFVHSLVTSLAYKRIYQFRKIYKKNGQIVQHILAHFTIQLRIYAFHVKLFPPIIFLCSILLLLALQISYFCRSVAFGTSSRSSRITATNEKKRSVRDAFSSRSVWIYVRHYQFWFYHFEMGPRSTQSVHKSTNEINSFFFQKKFKLKGTTIKYSIIIVFVPESIWMEFITIIMVFLWR